MSTRSERAVEYKKNGMNCAQSVALAFQDLTDLDETTVAALTQGFGVGIGASMEGTCGAIIGAVNMLGLIRKEDPRSENMKRAKRIISDFQKQNQSVICKELKGIGTGKVLRECNDCVKDAAELLEQVLEEA